MLQRVSSGFGMMAFAGLLGERAARQAVADYTNPLAPKEPHFAPKAKRIIYACMRGGPSHVDTFDDKPALAEHDGKAAPEQKGRTLMASPWKFEQHGQSGLPISELFPNLGKHADEMFLKKRRTAMTEAYTYSFDQAARLMEQKEVFDVTKESEKDQERYGKYDFGRQMLLARRLISSGVSFVQVQHTNYDSHYENFEFHIEQLGEFDRPFACLIQDLADMGLLESTLVVVMSEFGRTPNINQHYGRDHWGTAWSVAMAGAKLQPGAVIGKTNEKGTAVVEREVHHGHLFHTYLQAVGVDSTVPIQVGGRPTPIADPSVQPIKELIV